MKTQLFVGVTRESAEAVAEGLVAILGAARGYGERTVRNAMRLFIDGVSVDGITVEGCNFYGGGNQEKNHESTRTDG